MFWIIGIIVAGGLAAAWPLRRYVRIRRKDCCGQGCGCLFPVKKN